VPGPHALPSLDPLGGREIDDDGIRQRIQGGAQFLGALGHNEPLVGAHRFLEHSALARIFREQ
jgi:hypothetical protein